VKGYFASRSPDVYRSGRTRADSGQPLDPVRLPKSLGFNRGYAPSRGRFHPSREPRSGGWPGAGTDRPRR
jgi:hypothetical protein